jgi:hypothetical protein
MKSVTGAIMLRYSGCGERKPRPEYSSKIEIVVVVIAASPAGGQATAAGIFRKLRSAGYLPGSVVIQSGALLVFS